MATARIVENIITADISFLMIVELNEYYKMKMLKVFKFMQFI